MESKDPVAEIASNFAGFLDFARNDGISRAPHRYGSCFFSAMRQIKLTGREVSIVRAIGFTDSMLGTEIQDFARMDLEDVTDTLNALIAAGFVQSIPYCEAIELAAMPVTAFEVNPAYVHELKQAITRR